MIWEVINYFRSHSRIYFAAEAILSLIVAWQIDSSFWLLKLYVVIAPEFKNYLGIPSFTFRVQTASDIL